MADDGLPRKEIHGFKGGEKPRTPIEAPDSLYSTAMARILDLVSEGEVAMWVSDNPLKDTYLDETPVMNPDGSLNFKSVQLEYRTGTPDQSYIPGFPSVQSEFAVGVELKFATPWVRAVNNTQLSAVKVRLGVQALSKTNNTNGDVSGYRVDYAIDLSTDGGSYVEVFRSAFAGKTSSLYERTHRVDLPPATTGWNIRVRRLTPDSVTSYIQDTSVIAAITEVIDAKMRYPYSALVGITLDAQQFRSIPRRAYRLKGRIVRVPVNYNPTTRVYTGVWDGTFKLAWTNNPAWIYYDLATNQRYGLGRRVPESRIDKWSLYKIAQYCDELVPDGQGGTEPRFTCTVYLQRAADAYKVMKDLASVFRGISYWAGGAVVGLADQPEDPVYTYTNANVKDGKFAYNGTSKKARHTVAMVQYTNIDNFGKGEVEPVIDEEGIIRYGIQETTITAFGCTSQSQAHRVGRWLLLTERLLTDAVQFSVGQDGTLVAPGRIVRVLDSDRAGRRLGGRIKQAGANYVDVDALPDVLPVAGDTLITITPAGTAQESVVLSVNAPIKRITVSANFPAVPVAQSVWGLETVAIKPQTFRMLGITDNGDGSYGMAAVQHDSQIFDAVDLGTKIEAKPISILPLSVQQAPAAVTLTSVERAGEVLTSILVNADWDPVPGAAAYYIQWRRDDGEWSPPEKVTGSNADLANAFPGDLWARVWAINQSGIASPLTLSNKLVIADQSLKPGFVATLNASIADALTTAQNAQATADGKIDSFWQASPPVVGAGAGEAKEGDLWFDTDDGNKVYRVVSGAWVDAADDDMAQAIAAATTAQATADSKVRTFFTSSAPAATSVGDLWFNTTTKKLFRWSGTDWNSEIADVTLDQLGGTGVNIMPAEYSLFEQGSAPTTVRNGAVVPALPVLDAGALALNQPMLKWTSTGNDGYVYFDDSTLQYNIPLTPGKKWLVSFYMKSSVAAPTVNVYMKRNSDAGHTLVNVTGPAVAGNIERVHGVVDLSLFPNTTAAVLRLDLDVAGDIWVGGIMIEELIGRKIAPSAYARGTYSGLWANAIAVAEAAQDTADGKIETYFQTTPPTGSLGDLWFDTDDGNKIYRHNGTSFVACPDDDMAQAIAAAAGAQATADGKITTYYASTAPAGTKAVGDLWYDTVGKDLSRWNGATWIQVGDVTAEKIGGNGTNVMWEEYSLFTQAQSLLPSTVPAFGGQSNIATLQTVADAGAIGGFSLQAVTGSVAGHVRFASGATDNNMILGGNKKYLVSYYARTSAAGGSAIRPFLRGDMVVDYSNQNITTVRTRYSFVVDATAVAQANVQFGFFTNPSGGPAPAVHTLHIDGWMVEPMVGNVTTPSPFTPGPSARVTWRQMIQQNIADGGRNLVPNPGVVWNLVGAPTSGWVAEEAICDGWKLGLADARLAMQRTASDWKTGAWELVVQWGNNPPALANGQTARGIFMVGKPWAVIPGEKFVASVRAKSDFNAGLPVGVTGTAYLRCAFYDAAMTFISYGFTTIARAGGWAKYNTDPMTAPTNAAFMDVRLDFNITNASGAAQTPAAGSFPWILQVTDFEVFKLTNLDDDVEDGVTHGRIANQDTFAVALVRRLGLRVGNSGHRLGNQRNIPRSNTSAYGMVRTTTALSATSAGAVTVNAHTCRYGGYSVAYSAVANAVTGLTVGTSYVIYCSDPDLSGGVKTYFASTNPDAVMNISDDIYAVGQITIPSSGSSSGGGGSGGGDPGDWCVDADMVLPDGRLARDIRAGDFIPVWDNDPLVPGIVYLEVESNTLVPGQPSTRILSADARAEVWASDSTPMPTRDGGLVHITELANGEVLVLQSGHSPRWERVLSVEPVGPRTVAKIRVHQRCYFAGTLPGLTIATHNPTYKP